MSVTAPHLITEGELERTQQGDLDTQKRVDGTLIAPLEHQLNEAIHELAKMHNRSSLKEAQGQLATLKNQANKWLDALRQECTTTHVQLTHVTAERDAE